MATGKRDAGRALQKVLGQGGNVNAANPLEVHDPKVGSLISYEGVTTADGAADGSSLIDTVLASKPDYGGNLVIITSGAYAGQGSDITGVTTGGTVTAHTAFDGQILRGTNFVIVALRLTPAEVAALTLMVATNQYYDRIFFDDATGSPGTAWPVGTPQVPSNVIADVITMCAARNLYTICVHGAVTLGAAMQHYSFCGYEHEDVTDILDLSGEDVDGSHIEGLIVTGAQAGAAFLTLVRCIVNAITTFNGRMDRCSFWGGVTTTFKDGGYIDLIDCHSIYGAVTITVQAPARASIKNWRGNLILTAQDGGLCHVRGFKGTLEIDAMTAGTLNVYANGADITINADCIGTGTINIYGNARVTDNHGAGTTVNDYTKETQLDTVEALLDALGLQYVEGSVSDAGPAAADFDTDLTEATDNHYNGGLLLFIDGVCGGQAHVIDDYDGAAKNVSFSAEDRWTEAPGNGDNFIILPSTGTMAKAIYVALGTHDTDIKALLATIAGYIDTEIGAIITALGNVALEATLGTHDTDIKALLATIAGYIDTEIATIIAYVDELETRLTAARAGYLDELAAANLPTDVANVKGDTGNIVLDTQIRTIQSGVKVINAGITKYLHIDSGTNGAEILGIAIEGVIAHDWTLDVYVPAADAEAATQAKSKRDAIPYLAADAEGGLLKPFGIPFDCYLDFTNDGANDQIDQVTITYRSRGVLTLTWEA